MRPFQRLLLDESTKKLIMHAQIDVMGTPLMFSDVPPGMNFVIGNNISLTIQSKNSQELTRWFSAMKEGGKVIMELGPQSWSKLYGFVHDKFGVGWQFNLAE